MTSVSTVMGVLIGTFAAYSLARFDFKGKESIALDFLSIRMFPPIVAAIPIFIMALRLGLMNTYTMLILLNINFNLPLIVWVMRAFIMDIPPELEESAMVDGCTKFQSFLKITLPLIKPGIIAVGILSAIFSWNEFLFASILTGTETRTLPVVAATATFQQKGILWGPACALVLITSFPVIVLSLVVQKHIVRGLTFGALKG